MRYLSLAMLLLPMACAAPETQRDTSNKDDIASHEAEHDVASAPPVVPPLPPKPVPPPPATPGPDAPPVLDTLAPWFTQPPLAEALEAWENNDRDRALTIFDAFASAHPEDTRALPARFYSAWLAADDATPTNAMALAERFQTLALDWPLMSDIAHLRAAELLAMSSEAAPRASALELLARLPDESTYFGRSLALRTRLLMDTPDGKAKAQVALEKAAKGSPDGLLAESWDTLATLRDDTDKAHAKLARLELAVRFPNEDLGKAALKSLEFISLDGNQRIRLGRALFEAYRYDAMRGVIGTLKAPKSARCEAWILLGRAAERKKKDDDKALDKAFDYYEKALACDGDPRADATFLGGRALMTKKPKEARKLLEAHAAEFPDRSTADDALLLLAETEKSTKKQTRTLLDTLRRYPQGDMADAVAWDLVGPHVEARRWAQVLATTQQILEIAPDDVPGRHPGRYRYWHARALSELDRKDEAKAEWRKVFIDNPLSWYAILAYSRLDSADTQGLVPPNAPSEVGPPDLRVSATLWNDAHFRRALEWARLSGSVYDRASPFLPNIDLELDAVAKAARPRGDDWSWARVSIQQLGGGYARSMRLARSVEASGRLPFPIGVAALPWMLAYPRPFSEQVNLWAGERKIDADWIWSVMRVESNFDPEAVSWANAIGLMQIIMSTAKYLARDTTHAPTRENLMRPEIAIELGTKYLQRLLDRHKVVPLASAGYNAGGGAVSKWRKQFGNIDIDEFVERIPYREAHLYAKSVTQTLARYRWLYEGELFKLDLTPVGATNGEPTEPE